MSSAAASPAPLHDVLLPRAAGGNGAGALLALAVHGLLLLALTTAIDWRTHAPEIVSAELWAAVPQVAAPPREPPPAPDRPAPPVPQPAPQPAPQPVAPRQAQPEPEADIAVERARQRQLEADRRKEAARQAAEDKRKAALDKRKAEAEEKRLALEQRRQAEAERRQREQEQAEAKAEEERLAQQREANLRRMMGQAGAASGSTGGSGSALHTAAPSAAYAGRLIARIRPNIVYTGTAPASATAEVEVSAAPGGSILSKRLIKTSGHPEWDEAVLRAIDRTPSLPHDIDGRVPPRLTIAFRRD